MNRRVSRRSTRVPSGILAITSPLQIPGIAAWYRMDLLVTQAGTVSAWGDSSGTGDANKNLAQATAGKRPTYTAADAAYNNQPTATYAGASLQELDSAAWSAALSAPYTVFVVGNYDGGVGAEGWVGDSTNLVQLVINNGGTGTGAYSGAFIQSGMANAATPKIICAVFGTSGAIYDTARTARATGTTGTNALSRIFVGVDAGGHYINGTIAEVIVYSRALSAAEINAVMNYCGNRYAITVGS